MSNHRPAAAGLLMPYALAVLILLITIPAASAGIILDETITEYEDVSTSVTQPSNSQTINPNYDINGIYFKNIELYDSVGYISVDIAGNKHEEGRFLASYTLGSYTDSAVIYVAHTTNAFGIVTHTRFTIFPQNWHNGGLTNANTMSFSDFIFYTMGGRNDTATFHPTVGVASDNAFISTKGDKATVYVTAASIWSNQIYVSEDNGVYDINLIRNIDGISHPSTFTINNSSTIIYSHFGNDDKQVFYKNNLVTDIHINSGLKDYTYVLTSSSQPPSESAVNVYVRNTQTGTLLANAQLSILATAGDPPELYEVVNATLLGGTGTYSLEKADYLKYHASATADGYSLLSPIIFGVGDNGATIVLWMSPDAPADVPTEPEKSLLYG